MSVNALYRASAAAIGRRDGSPAERGGQPAAIDPQLPIEVRWTPDPDQLKRPAQGWTFFPDEPLFEGMTWREYALWVAGGGQAVRIWIGDQIAWRKGPGWIERFKGLELTVVSPRRAA